MNRLCRLSRVKGDLAGVGTTTTNDAVYLRQMDEASAEFVRQSGRQFAATAGTRYYQSGFVPGEFGAAGRVLWIGDDLISASEVLADLDNDGTYETALTVGTHIRYWPYNAAAVGQPYRALELIWNNPTVGIWPAGPHAVKVTGLFGFSYELEAVVGASSQLNGTLADASTLSLVIATDVTSYIDAGDVLALEDEQVEALSLAYSVPNTTVTCTRGLNGTTAAAHSSKAIYRRRYPRDVERVVAERVVSGRWDSQGGYQYGEGGNADRAVYARWMQAVRDYMNPASVF